MHRSFLEVGTLAEDFSSKYSVNWKSVTAEIYPESRRRAGVAGNMGNQPHVRLAQNYESTNTQRVPFIRTITTPPLSASSRANSNSPFGSIASGNPIPVVVPA